MRCRYAGGICLGGAATLLLGGVLAGCIAPPADRSALRAVNAEADLARYEERRIRVPRPLTLEAAVRTALENNLEVWIAKEETALQKELLGGATLGMLPELLVEGGASERSDYAARSSESLLTGQESLEPSFSSEKPHRYMTATATWNLLDFGVAAFRTRQAAHRQAIATERYRRTRQTLALRVRRAFWRAAAAREAVRIAKQVDASVRDLREVVRREIANRSIGEVEGLERETPLMEQQLRLRRYEQEYRVALAELSALLGLPVGSDIELAEVDFDTLPPNPAMATEELEREALHRRPELLEQDLEERITRDEARIALARLFPSPSAFASYDHDPDKYLYYNDWTTVGLRAVWDLLAVPRRLALHEAESRRADLVATQRTALAVGILVQVHLSVIEYEGELEAMLLARDIAVNRERLYEAARNKIEDGKGTAAESLAAEVQYLLARTQYLMRYANVMTACYRIETTIGRDPLEVVQDGCEAEAAETPPVAENPALPPEGWARAAVASAIPEGYRLVSRLNRQAEDKR